MEKVLDFVKNNRIKFTVIVVLIILATIGTCLFLDYKKKEYNLIEVSEYKYYVLNKDNSYGVIDTSGNIVIEPIYDNVKIPNPGKAIFICERDDKAIVLNENKEELFTEYEEITAISVNGIVSNIPYEKTVLKYKQDGKYGIISYEGKKITKPIYEEISGLENKESELLVKQAGKYGVINAKGATLIKPEYDGIVADGFYTNNDKYGLSGYVVNNKTAQGYRYGYINYKHKKILDVEYNSINRILETKETKDAYIIACKNGQYGVTKNNKIIINYSYQGIEYDSDNQIFELQRNEKYGIADYSGKEIIPVEYSEIEINGLYIKTLKNEVKEPIYYNVLGEKITDLKYSAMLKTSNDNYYITIDKDGFYGIINGQNEELVENKYSYIEYLFGEYFITANENGYLGIIDANENGYLGIIDANDNVKVDFKYEVLQKIDGTNVVEAKILKENKSELYSANLENIYSMKNASVYKEEQYIKVYSNTEIKYFDFNGKELENTEVFSENKLLSSKKDDKWGFIDRTGNVIVDYKYDNVTEFNDYGFAGIRQNNKWGVIDANGNIILEPIYEIENSNNEPEFLGEFYKVYYGYGESYYTNKVR